MLISTTYRRWIVLVFAYLEVFLFSGIMLGWGELVYVLKREGMFSDRCKTTIRNGTHLAANTCDAAEDMFNRYFSMTTAVGTLLVLPLGHCFSRLGTRITRLIFTVTCCIGCILLAFANNDRPWLIYIGGMLVMGSGYVYPVTSVQIANLFSGNTAATVISSISGMKISSCAVLLILKVAYVHGISPKVSFLTLAGLTSIPLLSTMTLFPKMFFYKNETIEYESLQHTPDQDIKVTGNKAELVNNSPGTITAKTELELTEFNRDASYGTYNSKSVIEHTEGNKQQCKSTEENRPGERQCKSTEEESDQTFHCMTFVKILTSFLFLTHVFWMVVTRLRIMYFFGEMNHYLERITHLDDAKVSFYSDVVYHTMGFGVIFCLIVGVIYDLQRKLFTGMSDQVRRKGMSAILPLAATSIVGAVVTCLMMSNDPKVTYALAIMFTLLRSLAISVGNTYLSDAFHVSMFGNLYGVRHVIVYGLSIIQYPIFKWSIAYPAANIHVTLFLAVLSLSSLIHPLWVYRTFEKQS